MKRPSTVRAAVPMQRPFERTLAGLLLPPGAPEHELEHLFAAPLGAPALTPAGGVSWRICANPVSVFVGGVAAVILELAEPRVRSGVWEHTQFRVRPVERMRATGLATMMAIYGPAEEARRRISEVNRRHATVNGRTPAGEPYSALDPTLLAWVQATALFGFLQAYRSLVAPVEPELADTYYAENCATARLYGVETPPCCEADVAGLFEAMLPRLEPSDIVFEFLDIVARMPALPAPLRWLQPALVQAAVECVPQPVRMRLALERPRWQPDAARRLLARTSARLASLRPLATHPATLACRRLDLAPCALAPGSPPCGAPWNDPSETTSTSGRRAGAPGSS